MSRSLARITSEQLSHHPASGLPGSGETRIPCRPQIAHAPCLVTCAGEAVGATLAPRPRCPAAALPTAAALPAAALSASTGGGEAPPPPFAPSFAAGCSSSPAFRAFVSSWCRKVDIRLHEKGNSNSHGLLKHLDDVVDSDQKVINEELSPSLKGLSLRATPRPARAFEAVAVQPLRVVQTTDTAHCNPKISTVSGRGKREGVDAVWCFEVGFGLRASGFG